MTPIRLDQVKNLVKILGDKENILVKQVIEHKDPILVGTGATAWSIGAAKSGYTPIMFSPLAHGNSPYVKVGIESIVMQDGKFLIDGFARSLTGGETTVKALRCVVLWQKNTAGS